MIAEDLFGNMAAFRPPDIVPVPLMEVIDGIRQVVRSHMLVGGEAQRSVTAKSVGLVRKVSSGDGMAGRKLPACWAESVVNAVDRARPRTPVPFSAIGSAAGVVVLSAVQAARRQV